MIKYKEIILCILFLLISFFGIAQTMMINNDMLNAEVITRETISIYTTKSNIILSGRFISKNRNTSNLFVSIKPNEKHFIRIVPVKKTKHKRSSYIGIEDDDDDTHEGDLDVMRRITLSPNPTKTKTTINTTDRISKIEIFNSYGFLQLTTNNNIIDLSNYKNGFYIVKIHFENSKVVNKTILKQ